MTQITTGIRSILSIAALYSLYQKMVFPKKKLISEYIKPYAGQKILDIGCGTGDLCQYLPDSHYFGIDLSEKYIRTATMRYGHHARFQQASVDDFELKDPHTFDMSISIGVLHHISDDETIKLLKLAKKGIKRSGRFLAVEPCYTSDQSRLAKWIIDKDRGQNVKNIQSYLDLARQVFSNVTYEIRHDLLRIPFTLILLECRNEHGSQAVCEN